MTPKTQSDLQQKNVLEDTLEEAMTTQQPVDATFMGTLQDITRLQVSMGFDKHNTAILRKAGCHVAAQDPYAFMQYQKFLDTQLSASARYIPATLSNLKLYPSPEDRAQGHFKLYMDSLSSIVSAEKTKTPLAAIEPYPVFAHAHRVFHQAAQNLRAIRQDRDPLHPSQHADFLVLKHRY